MDGPFLVNNLSRSLVRSSLLSGLMLLVISGCGGSEQVQTVSGTVSYRGNPLDSGLVSFFPGGGRPIGAPINANGTYQAELPPGDYTVAISATPTVPADMQEGDRPPPRDPNALPIRYSTPNQSGLRVTVSAEGRSQTEDFEL